MNKVIASAGLLALGAVGVQTVQAQWTAGSDKSWSVSATLRGFYDDNYNTQPGGTNRVSSYGFEVRPSLKWNVDLGPTTIDLSYVYALKYYDARPNNKYDQDHDFEVFLNHNFNNRYSVDFSDSFVIDQEPEIIDPTLSTPVRANGNNIRNTASINFHAELTPLLGMVLGYGNSYFSYDQNQNTPGVTLPSLSALLDRVEHRVNLDSQWHIWEETTGIFGYTFGAVDYTSSESISSVPFPFVPLAVASSSRNKYSHTVYVGANHNFSPDLTVSARGGFEYDDYYNSLPGNSKNNTIPFASVSLNYAYMDGGSVALGFNHSSNPTDQGATFLTTGGVTNISVTLDQESSSLFGTITQRLTPLSPDLTATLSAQYQNSTFNGGVNNNQSDDFYIFGLNLSYQFTRYISGEVGYNYDLLSSSLPGRAYHRNRVYVGVSASY
jgi:hypothetical protein